MKTKLQNWKKKEIQVKFQAVLVGGPLLCPLQEEGTWEGQALAEDGG